MILAVIFTLVLYYLWQPYVIGRPLYFRLVVSFSFVLLSSFSLAD